jgi:hypothetical protein
MAGIKTVYLDTSALVMPVPQEYAVRIAIVQLESVDWTYSKRCNTVVTVTRFCRSLPPMNVLAGRAQNF